MGLIFLSPLFFFLMIRRPPRSTLFSYTTLFLSDRKSTRLNSSHTVFVCRFCLRSEEHTSELQSHSDIVCRLLLEKKKLFQRRPFLLTPAGERLFRLI